MHTITSRCFSRINCHAWKGASTSIRTGGIWLQASCAIPRQVLVRRGRSLKWSSWEKRDTLEDNRTTHLEEELISVKAFLTPRPHSQDVSHPQVGHSTSICYESKQWLFEEAPSDGNRLNGNKYPQHAALHRRRPPQNRRSFARLVDRRQSAALSIVYVPSQDWGPPVELNQRSHLSRVTPHDHRVPLPRRTDVTPWYGSGVSGAVNQP